MIWQQCSAGFAFGRISTQQTGRPNLCKGFVAKGSGKKGLHSATPVSLCYNSLYSSTSLSLTLVITGVEALLRSIQRFAAGAGARA